MDSQSEEALRRTLAALTLEQKCALLSGAGEWQSRAYPDQGVESIWMSDGPNGLRKQEGSGDHLGLNASVKATCFPTAAAMANTWNPALGEQVGRALGEEAAAQRVNVLLGPGLNTKRSPLCGRSFEYFSEDPYLSGKMAAGYVRGIQSVGIAACPKHLAANSQELRRMSSNSVLDERTLRELYLTNFEIVVQESAPKTIMSSYNALNGTYTNEDKWLLTDVLRGEWGFDGAVLTDWGGSNSHTAGVQAGSTLEMPNPGYGSVLELLAAVRAGVLDEADVDARVLELLRLSAETNAALRQAPASFDEEAHHALARTAAAESLVLLKNEGGLLPLPEGTKVAVIGDFARTPRYQGAGSSKVNPTRLDSVLQEMTAQDGLTVVGFAPGYKRSGHPSDALLLEAVELAKKAEAVVFCLGLSESSESEGLDRTHMKLYENQVRVLEAVAAANPKVITVLSAGSAIETDWIRYSPAVLHSYLSGQAGAGAVADVLCGRVNPSGKLAETLPLAYEDTPAAAYFPSVRRNACYREGLYVGYRYYETAGVRVAFPFGFGLSYTRFSYSNLKICGNTVTFTLANVGQRAGKEIVQLYVQKTDGEIFRPKKELKAFAKAELQPGERRTVTLTLDDKTFRYWNSLTHHWEVEGGAYRLLVGASCRDIRLRGEITLEGTHAPNPCTAPELDCYRTGHIQNVTDAQFAALLGHSVPKEPHRIDSNSTFRDLLQGRSPFFWLVWWVLTRLYRRSLKREIPDLNVLFLYNMPLRALSKMTGGKIGRQTVDGLVMELKGLWGVGLLRALLGVVQNNHTAKRLKTRLERHSKVPK